LVLGSIALFWDRSRNAGNNRVDSSPPSFESVPKPTLPPNPEPHEPSAVATGPPQRGPRNSLFGYNGSITGLLGTLEVQSELTLSAEQKTRITTLLEENRDKRRGAFATVENSQYMRTLTREERQKRFDEAGKKAEEIRKRVEEEVGAILDPKQAERLRELALQSMGAAALTRPDVIKKLDLSEDQQARIKRIAEAGRPRGTFGLNQSTEEIRAAMQKQRDKFQETMNNVVTVLNKDQLPEWLKMRGQLFEPRVVEGDQGGAQRTPPAPRAP
jgi:hypothetical protein